jgi:4'-phosphopantetheinyl transferase
MKAARFDDAPSWPGTGLSGIPLGLRDGDHLHRCVMAACDGPLDELERQVRPVLTPAEATQLARAAHPRRRLSFLRGRMAAKEALVRIGGEGATHHAFEIVPGVFEQPLVRGPVPNLGVSLSHTDALAVAIAFPESHPLGLDLERVSSENHAVLREQMTSDELDRMLSLDVAEPEALTMLWAAKEALSKVLRGGLAIDFLALAITAVEWRRDVIEMRFVSFAHLRAEVIRVSHHVLALVLPARCRCSWDQARTWLTAIAGEA